MIEQYEEQPDGSFHNRLLQHAARYYLHGKNVRNEPFDPVARFHLKNGAILDRINAGADDSEKGKQQSFGVMVNYVYDLARVEDNHENYMKNYQIAFSSQVNKLLG